MSFRLPHAMRAAITGASTLVASLALVSQAVAAGSSDATLATTVHRWSSVAGADARAVSLNARQRHPRLMTASALRFSGDARRARSAIVRQHASSGKGRQAKSLALRAFSAYVLAGRRWAASGRARVRGQRAVATTFARRGAAYAAKGNRLLLSAGALLR